MQEQQIAIFQIARTVCIHSQLRLGHGAAAQSTVDFLTMLTILQMHFVISKGLVRTRGIKLERSDENSVRL